MTAEQVRARQIDAIDAALGSWVARRALGAEGVRLARANRRYWQEAPAADLDRLAALLEQEPAHAVGAEAGVPGEPYEAAGRVELVRFAPGAERYLTVLVADPANPEADPGEWQLSLGACEVTADGSDVGGPELVEWLMAHLAEVRLRIDPDRYIPVTRAEFTSAAATPKEDA